MRILLAFALGALSLCAADTRVNFTLDTIDAYGAPLRQSRTYFVTRPDGVPKTTPMPMVLVFAAAGNSGVDSLFRRIASTAGFLIVSCSFSGNSTGTPGSVWTSDGSSFAGPEDYDYTTEVIRRVRESDNGSDAFVAGLSKGGHMALAYACERPSMIKAAATIDEFMQPANRPTVPVPVIAFQGTQDTNVAYTMTRDTLDVWRAYHGLLAAAPVMSYEASPLQPGHVTQATWGSRVAFVTIVGGTHTYATPDIQTGYDQATAAWAFFSQVLTPTQDAPRIVSQPVNNVQPAGSPASFHVVANARVEARYQWQKNGADIPGATDSWYTTAPLTPEDNGATFRAVVTNAAGSATSATATLTVLAGGGPVIADRVATAGQPATFTAAWAGAGPAAFQWKKNGMPIAGATDATLTVLPLTTDSGAVFSVSAGGVTSNPAALTVMPAAGAPIILENPARARVLVNQPATFAVKAWSTSPVTYQWQKGTFTGNMADIPGATASTYTFAQPALADHLTLVRCVVSNAAGSSVSGAEMLFVTAAAAPPNQIVSAIHAAAQAGAPFVYDIVATGGTSPLTFAAAPLPAGLTLDPASGRISGAPPQPGSTVITIEASNAVGKVSTPLMLVVSAAPPVVPIEDWRVAHFGAGSSNAAVAGDAADPDGDSCTNRQEYDGGSDPLDRASVPTAFPAMRRGRSGCPHRPVR